MSFKIAVAGKGGTGKTTVAALMVAVLKRMNRSAILAVDADPNACLADYLGVEVEQTLGEIRDDTLAKKDEIPAGVSKAQIVEYQMHRCLVEEHGFDLVTMGRTEGPGCYCYVNNLLRGFMGDLEDAYGYVVIDNEAGMEHLSRRTSRRVDLLAVVADASRASLTAAKRIADIVGELDIDVKEKVLVLNRTAPDACGDSPVNGMALAGCVPSDPALAGLDARGGALFDLPEDSPAASAVEDILKRFID